MKAGRWNSFGSVLLNVPAPLWAVLVALVGLTHVLAAFSGPDGLSRWSVEGISPSAGDLIVTEVMYGPPSGAPEWVEVYNAGDSQVLLDGLLFSDNEGTDLNEGEFWFPTGVGLDPGAFLVLGSASGTEIDLVWGRGGPILSNSGDEINLVWDFDNNGLFTASEVLEGFRYVPSWGGSGDGSSLSRTCLDCDASAASSWTSSLSPGGTPGGANDTLDPEATPPPALPAHGKRILFDMAHCQTCGNADWTITGGYSDLANGLRSLGFEVASSTSPISVSALTSIDILVIPEPNTQFSTTEKNAMVDFTRKGKGIWMIANHFGSDRNSDGWDSVEVFNGYLSGKRTSTNDWLANNFRFRFKESSYEQDPVTDIRSTVVTQGVEAVGLYSGTTQEVLDASRVQGVIYLNDVNRGPMVSLVSPSSGGRIVAQGDSSMYDDGTCSCSDDLHNNWDAHDHIPLALQAGLWLAGLL